MRTVHPNFYNNYNVTFIKAMLVRAGYKPKNEHIITKKPDWLVKELTDKAESKREMRAKKRLNAVQNGSMQMLTKVKRKRWWQR